MPDLTPCADREDALHRSAKWMEGGSPAHDFEGEPGEDWCRSCGCAAPGLQHTDPEAWAALHARDPFQGSSGDWP